MTTADRFVKELKKASTQLKKVGITSLVHTDPNGWSDEPEFVLGLNSTRDKLEFNFTIYTECDFEDIEFHTTLKVLGVSKKHRQAVLQLQEPARQLTREVVALGSPEKESRSERERLRDELNEGKNFPIALPEGTKYKAEFKEFRAPGFNLKSYSDYVFMVTATVPKSEQYFLVGFDEQHMFVSCLPKKATTVAQAHDVLIPPEVKRAKGVIRQGEFFLVPLNEREQKSLDKSLRKSLMGLTDYEVEVHESDHIATVSVNQTWRGKDYQVITGVMYNNRHFTVLNGWYKVIPNLELPNPNDEQLWD